MMETLNQTILNQCREEVAKAKGASSFEWYEKHMVAMGNHDYLALAHEQAAELAMDRQWSFSMWIRSAGYKKMSDSRWSNRRTFEKHTTEDLYQIWREGK